MSELNSRGILPLADVKKHYDKAVIDYPATYTRYTFEQWMDYMQSRLLIVRYPSGMVDFSHNGKDFLRYVAHRGWDVNAKVN
jgi:hypothetical protein